MIPAADPAAANGLGAVAEAVALGAEPAASWADGVTVAGGVCGSTVAATGSSVPASGWITVPPVSPMG